MKRLTRDIDPSEAPEYILGYTCVNDVTARDLQKREGQWMRAKSFDPFCPLGPCIETDLQPAGRHVECLLNGEVKQGSSTANQIFPPFFLVSFISRVMTLLPGDVIATGTPPGVGPMKVGDVIVKQLLRKAQWQVSIMSEIHPRPILFLDEPYLAAFGSAFTSIDRDTVLSTFREFFSGIGAPTGIHCCGNTDWSLVLASGPCILSFDAYSYVDSLYLYTEELTRFLSRGGIIAWGIVPTNESDIKKETAEGLLARLEGAWERLARLGFGMRDIVAKSLITPSCGLGTVSIEAATEAFRITRQICEHIRRSFDLNW